MCPGASCLCDKPREAEPLCSRHGAFYNFYLCRERVIFKKQDLGIPGRRAWALRPSWRTARGLDRGTRCRSGVWTRPPFVCSLRCAAGDRPGSAFPEASAEAG